MRRLLYACFLMLLPGTASAQVLPFVPPLVPRDALRLWNAADSVEGGKKPHQLTSKQRLRVDTLRAAYYSIIDRAYGDPVLSLIGSGGLKNLQPSDTTADGSSASGAIGLRLVTSFAQYTALVNVVAEDPVVTSGFAGALLSPGNGTRGVVLDYQRGRIATTFRGSNTPPTRWGWHGLAAISSAAWRDGDEVRDVVALSASLRMTRDFFRAADTTGKRQGLDYGARLDFGSTMRYLNIDGSAPAGFRKRVLGSHQAIYPGLEGGLTLLVGNFVATGRLTFLPDFGMGQVEGLTGLRFTSGITLQADLARLPVRFR